MINIQNIKFAYSREVVLDGFSLQFDKGGIYGLLGKNGTGKSTLLYLMMGLLRPQKGIVTVDGINTTLRRPEVLSEMFLVPEEYDLPAISLSAYVKAIKPFYPRFSEELLQKSLDSFEMSSNINLGQLSMGQKKKVYMSVAMASNTRHLLMDEPTNGLDIPPIRCTMWSCCSTTSASSSATRCCSTNPSWRRTSQSTWKSCLSRQ